MKSLRITASSFAAIVMLFFPVRASTVARAPSCAEAFLSEPLVSNIYTADPAVHVFNGRLYIYTSHDIEAGITNSADGNQYAMRDYHVFSMEKVDGKMTDHGVPLDIKDIPWAGRQLWAPDVASRNGKYYLYFPVKDKMDIFRIGVATSMSPIGPFKPEAEPIKGGYSIDPAVFADGDGEFYMYFGGIQGGQLQRWPNNQYQPEGPQQAKDPLPILPRVGKLSTDMLNFSEPVREVQIVDQSGVPIAVDDIERRFFEGCWVHKYQGIYYLSYSTGTTHKICYATSSSPYGPFTYRGVLLNPVKGWTTQQSIVEIDGKWYLFYHDTQLSGKNYLRNIKMTEIKYNEDGTLRTIDPINK